MTNAETNDTAATVAQQCATVAPEKTSSKKAARPTKGAPKDEKTASSAQRRKPAKTGRKPACRATGRTQSKGAKILEMIGRAKGATLAEIMTATGWQAHSVRGFISTAGKKHGVKIESLKNEAGNRVYQAAK
jgi:hypothetical protein